MSRILRHVPEDLPARAQIEITNICNLDCRMCIRNFIRLERKHMDYDVFRRVVDKLRGVKVLTLTGYGEPFAHPRIMDAIRYCKERGFEVHITSNGLLINAEQRLDEVIASGLDSLAFSLEGVDYAEEVGHSNLTALESISKLTELKKKTGSSAPLVTLQTLMIKGKEKELFNLIEWGALNGADRINIVRFDLNTLRDVARPDRHEEKELFARFAELRRKHKIRIDCIQDQLYTGIMGFLYKYLKILLQLDRHCIRLQDFTYVGVNGEIRPCCALVGHEMDSLLDGDLKQIWTSAKYDRFRKLHRGIPWCAKCDAFCLEQKDIPAER